MHKVITSDDALEISQARRRHSERYLYHREVVAFYSSGRHGIHPLEALTVADGSSRSAVNHTLCETACLRRLNAHLLDEGAAVGDQCLVVRSLYRVSNAGQLAVYLGEQIPADELHMHYEGLDNAGDELAEARSSYADSIRVSH